MRRLKSAVSLIGLRCDGSAHGACQAQCYLIWKEAWLRPVSRSARRPAPSRAAVVTAPAASRASASVASGGCDRADRPAAPTRPAQPQTQFRCQFTQLAAASLPMRGWDIRQDLRPLIAGNVTLLAFGMAMLTRLFNRIQMLRHGVPFPSAFPSESTGSVPAATFEPGERVRVRPAPDIASTLDARGRNRGLWFDLDMLKYCDHSYEVAGRVERVIDAATGRMLHMKTSCLTLEGVTSSGEFLRFCPQHEQIFWREIWLRPVDRKHEVPQA